MKKWAAPSFLPSAPPFAPHLAHEHDKLMQKIKRLVAHLDRYGLAINDQPQLTPALL